MKKESGAKAKVGDRICIVFPVDTYGNYENGNEGEITNVDEKGAMVFFDHYEEGSGSMYVFNDEFEVITTGESKTAESLRNSILDIRSKREALQKEILQLDKQEKEVVEKLKEQGFVLYEGNVSKELVITEKKAVLYAEDIEEDMNNCENWKNGDILKVITLDNRMVPFGALVKHTDADGSMSPFTSSEYHDRWAISDCCLKFHSRPVK